MDRLSSERRSWNMSRVRSKDTKPELLVRRYLYAKGLRYRLNSKLPGKPDLVFPTQHVAVFVNGCFWHRHGCTIAYTPKSNKNFWQKKFQDNITRDQLNASKLQDAGWSVVNVWECEIRRDIGKSIIGLEEVLGKLGVKFRNYKLR